MTTQARQILEATITAIAAADGFKARLFALETAKPVIDVLTDSGRELATIRVTPQGKQINWCSANSSDLSLEAADRMIAALKVAKSIAAVL